MQVTLKTTLRSLITFIPLCSFAKINYRTGAYETSAVDAEISMAESGDGLFFQLRRSYNSRTLHAGAFGFGWCADFEKSLDLRHHEKIYLHDCRFSADRVYEKRRPGRYVSLEDPDDVISVSRDGYQRKTRTTLQTFSTHGHLTSLSDLRVDPHRFTLKILYDGEEGLRALQLPDSSEILVQLDPSRRRILTATQAGKIIARYNYDNGNLIMASTTRLRSGAAITTRYRYDDAHNLTAIDRGDEASELITYDTATDTVRHVAESSGCQETVTIASSPLKKDRARTVEERIVSKRACPHARTTVAVHRFTYTANTRGRISSTYSQGGPIP
jgi:YD repeat-containing protein